MCQEMGLSVPRFPNHPLWQVIPNCPYSCQSRTSPYSQVQPGGFFRKQHTSAVPSVYASPATTRRVTFLWLSCPDCSPLISYHSPACPLPSRHTDFFSVFKSAKVIPATGPLLYTLSLSLNSDLNVSPSPRPSLITSHCLSHSSTFILCIRMSKQYLTCLLCALCNSFELQVPGEQALMGFVQGDSPTTKNINLHTLETEGLTLWHCGFCRNA